MTIRILIADDHRVVSEGLSMFISAEKDMEVVACAPDGRAAVRVAAKLTPDIILMDHLMPGLNGIEATGIIRARLPETRVIVLSMYSDPIHVCRALQAGASGYVVKRSAGREVTQAIRTVCSGHRYLSKRLAEAVIDRYLDGGEDPLDRLSSRERQVLQMMAEGNSVADIATNLALSPKTVETYRARMMQKLAIRDLANLVRFAIQRGIAALD
jgi:two-component system, NarL family, response regulator NreC